MAAGPAGGGISRGRAGEMATGPAGGGISRGRAGEMFAVPVAVGRQGALNSEDVMKLMDICAVDKLRAEDALAFTRGDFKLAFERLMPPATEEDIAQLKVEMAAAAESEDFEKAAALKKKIKTAESMRR